MDFFICYFYLRDEGHFNALVRAESEEDARQKCAAFYALDFSNDSVLAFGVFRVSSFEAPVTTITLPSEPDELWQTSEWQRKFGQKEK